MIFYKLYSVATPRHPKPLLLENRIYNVALTPNLQRVFFYSIIVFLYHSFDHRAYIISNTSKGVLSKL